jgi:hypothetical protein
MHVSAYKHTMKKKLPSDVVFKLNEAFWDRNLTETKIKNEFKVSMAVLSRAITQTRREWEHLKAAQNASVV